MRRGFVCIVLAGMLAAGISVAEGAAVPSKMTEDLAHVLEVLGTDGSKLPEGFLLSPVKETQETLSVFESIYDHAVRQELPLITYFDPAVQSETALLLPEAFNLDQLVMYEFTPITAFNYEEGFGDIIADFQFATPYADGQAAVALVGIVEKTEGTDMPVIKWTALPAKVENGLVKITFPKTMVSIIEERGALLLILSELLATP